MKNEIKFFLKNISSWLGVKENPLLRFSRSNQPHIFILIFCFAIFSCTQKSNSSHENSAPDSTVALEKVKTNLPDSAGAEVFKSNCIVCHSLRYIQMQPNFPQKTWEKTVDKMRKMYGAPIDSVSAKIIVNYLMKIKGKK